jgi:hypothetical protein
MRSILSSFLVTTCTLLHAQEKPVYLYTNGKLIQGYELLIPDSHDNYQRESYTFFKGQMWQQGKRAEVLSGEVDSNGNYAEGSGKRTKKYQAYALCDPEVNNIRNKAAYHGMEQMADSVMRIKVGYSPANGYGNFKALHRIPDSLVRTSCFNEFQVLLAPIQKQWLTYIDSLEQAKKAILQLIIAHPESIDAAFIGQFLSTLDHNETDMRSLERIIAQQPVAFVDVLYKLSEEEFNRLCWRMHEFPKDLDLTEARLALKQTDVKNPRKRKLLRKLKNKS